MSDDVSKMFHFFSSYVSQALDSFLIVLKSRRWYCAAAMILAAVDAYVATAKAVALAMRN